VRRTPAETPLMRQYLEVKDRYPDAILFFRLGDFYEMFFEDALEASKLLDLTLTTRDKGRDDAVPMCGVPHHAARGYVARLCELGHKVVICEQVEDPRLAKGIVKREVTRVITPGIVLDEEILDAKAARYLAAIAVGEGGARGLAYLDVSSGDFAATELGSDEALIDEIARVDPREVLAAAGELDGDEAPLAPLRRAHRGARYSTIEPAAPAAAAALVGEAMAASPADLGLEALPLALRAVADVIAYARATQPAGALPLARLRVYQPGETLVLDEASKTNLELTETIVGRQRKGSLFGVLDQTETALGGRLLRRWLLFPLTDVAAVRRRQDAVAHLVERPSLRAELRAALSEIADLERLAGRITLRAASPRDLQSLRRSLERLPTLAELVEQDLARELDPPELLRVPRAALAELGEVAADVAAVICDQAPASAGEGNLVRAGWSAEIDELRALADGGKDQILAIELRERDRTGIGSLKVRYNRVFGYYLEITRSNLASVPTDYVRKQTLANAERYVTPELAELEAKVLGAEDKLKGLEAEVFEALRQRVAARAAAILGAAERVATLDVCAALAEVAHAGGYVRPEVDDGEIIEIEDGRHPVVERLAAAGGFVPNDCRLDPAGERIVIITGPNMAGKSTYMRQVALTVLLAQMGAFVPARRARIGVVDRVFTRVGAADNLARGESTFMVEMRETAHILRHATRRSLILLDEIGRGTSTYDGVSIAWAVAEYLHDAVGAKTLFATHYHELCALAARRPAVKNVSVAVREVRGDVVFLRKVVPGGASRSYGIEVARLAGLPRSVVGRARQVLKELEGKGELERGSQLPLYLSEVASSAPPPTAVEKALLDIDLDRLTPLEALVHLSELRRLVKR
jgi:DNA mismatch repair protein MutS